MRVIRWTKADSYRWPKLQIRVIFKWFKNFDFKVVWALKYGPLKNSRRMAYITFDYTVFFYLDIIGFSNNFLQFIEILETFLFKVIRGLDLLFKCWVVIRNLFWFELLVLFNWRILSLSFLCKLLQWLIFYFSFWD